MTGTTARTLPLGPRIVWARKRKGISQERLAVTVGTTRRHMIRIEKGLHTPRPALLARIAEATDQPVEFFTDDDEDSQAVSLADVLRLEVREAVRQVLLKASA